MSPMRNLILRNSKVEQIFFSINQTRSEPRIWNHEHGTVAQAQLRESGMHSCIFILIGLVSPRYKYPIFAI
jgi:hypothetical protein